jgi:hypothetical protein
MKLTTGVTTQRVIGRNTKDTQGKIYWCIGLSLVTYGPGTTSDSLGFL